MSEHEVRTGDDELNTIRAEIERIDLAVLTLLSERVGLARRAGALKRSAGVFTLDPEREAAVVRRAAVSARELGLDDEDVRAIFWGIIGLSRRAQMDGSDGD